PGASGRTRPVRGRRSKQLVERVTGAAGARPRPRSAAKRRENGSGQTAKVFFAPLRTKAHGCAHAHSCVTRAGPGACGNRMTRPNAKHRATWGAVAEPRAL